MRQDDQRADATQADAANQRADANQADAVAADQSFDDTVEAVVKRLKANRANTLALCACLAVCETRMPYREAETLIGQRPELNLSTQNAHALLRIMIDCGGVEAEEVPEPACEPGDEKQDQPVDYTVRTTEAGRAALARFEPTKRFGRMLQDEPAGYAQAYAIVLALCEDGATKAAIEQALEGNPALSNPEAGIPQLLHLRSWRPWVVLHGTGSWKSHGSRPADAGPGRVKRCSIAARANGRSHLR